jgi:acetyl-CoA carboxylase biotin carboxyl carrier protein
MDKKEINELIDLMDEADLSAIRITEGDKKIELERSRGTFSGIGMPAVAERVEQLLEGKSQSHQIAPVDDSADENGVVVRSPMVGTFYTAPSPDEPPFVKVGQEVITGQTLALVEAMKVMNEITATAPGTITEVLAANGTQIEYDQPLFRIDTGAGA